VVHLYERYDSKKAALLGKKRLSRAGYTANKLFIKKVKYKKHNEYFVASKRRMYA
jgi:hypothetical protein